MSWQINYSSASTGLTNQTVTSYSGTNRTVISTAPDGSYTINAYGSGRLMSSVRYDANHNSVGSTSYSYDAHGRQYQVTDARDGTTTYSYNAADQVATVTTPPPGNGQAPQTTTTLYDTLLRPYSVIQPDGTTLNPTYLLTGELGQQSGCRTYPAAYSYDYAGRMHTMTNWSGFGTLTGPRVTTWLYDGQRGWLTNKVYADSNGPAYTYTPGGRLQSRVWVRSDSSGNTNISTSYAYDAAGGLTNILYSDGTPSVTNCYNRLGQLNSMVCNGMRDSLAYNLSGQLLSESFAGGPLSGLMVSNCYDTFLRRTNLALLNAPSTILASTAYGYDNASRLAMVTRLATAYDANNDIVTNSYLANSPLVGQITLKQNSTTRMTTTKQYDYLNRLTAIASQPSGTGGPPVSFNYSYNNANQRTQDKLADGSYWVYQYDSLGQVTSGIKYFYDGTPVPGQQFGYSFDTIGNRTQTIAGGDQTGANLRLANYWANNLNQITSRDIPGTNDIIGVALATNSVTVNGQPAWHKWEYFRGTVQTNNSVGPAWLSATVASGGTSNTGGLFMPKTPEHCSYDADGNLTNDGRWAYTWDAENRLIAMTANATVGPQYQLTFAYDAKGRRIQKIVSNGATVTTNDFLYDGWNLVAELQPNNALTRTYVWGSDLSGSLQGAGGVGGLLEVCCYGASVTNCFAAFDGNGNLAALVNTVDGTVTANYEYGPFGEVIRATGPMAKVNPMRFSTKYDDDESDLLYYGYRYYKPSTGTWVNRDPIGERGGANIYGYVRNDPIQLSDLFGLDWSVVRVHGPTALAICKCGDTWDALARKVHMDTSDYQKWVNTTDVDPIAGKIYNIPNTIIFEYGQASTWVAVIDIWRQQAKGDKSRWEDEGYFTIDVDPTTSGQMVVDMKSPTLYGMVYIGHGDEDGGGVLDMSDLDYLKPDRFTRYGIAFLNLKACHSADTVTPKQGWKFNKWEYNVAKRGWFTGYEGDVDTFNEVFQFRATHGKNR